MSRRHYQRLGDPLPLRLPDQLEGRSLGGASFTRQDEDWQIAAIEVTAPGRGWVEFDGLDPVAAPTNQPPEEVEYRDGAPSSLALTYSAFGRQLEIYGDRVGSVELWLGGETAQRARPRRPAWEEFWNAIEDLNPWGWPRWHHPLRRGTDGQFWSLLIAHGGRLARSRGYQAFPPEGLPDPDSLEQIAAAALRHLFALPLDSWGESALSPELGPARAP